MNTCVAIFRITQKCSRNAKSPGDVLTSLYMCAAVGGTYINAAYLQSTLANSTLSQTLGPLTPGATYNLTYSLRNDFTPTDNFTATNFWTAAVGSVVLDSMFAFPASDFVIRSFLFTAPVGSTTLPLIFSYRQVSS